MNFPQVHGARIVPQPDPELVAAEARLAALDSEELVTVRPAWIDETVAKVAAATPVVRGGRLRRAAAAAVAFFALHGFATAATVTAVTAATVTAVVLWPEGRNSSETMSYELALQLVLREDQPEEARASAMIQVIRRVKGGIDALRATDRAINAEGYVRAAATRGLLQIGECLAGKPLVDSRSSVADPLPTILSIFDPTESHALDIEGVDLCTRGACRGIEAIQAMPSSNARLAKDREVALRRLLTMLRR